MDILKKTRYKKLFTHVESHTGAVSLLESGEQRYIKAINNNNVYVYALRIISPVYVRLWIVEIHPLSTDLGGVLLTASILT